MMSMLYALTIIQHKHELKHQIVYINMYDVRHMINNLKILKDEGTINLNLSAMSQASQTSLCTNDRIQKETDFKIQEKL